MKHQKAVNVRLTDLEYIQLDRLSIETGRPMSNIVRTLILWVVNDPDLKKNLGCVPNIQEEK